MIDPNTSAGTPEIRFETGAGQPVADPETLTLAIMQACSRGDLQLARRIATSATVAYPNVATLHHVLAGVETRLGNTQAAIAHEEQALLLDPGFSEAETNLHRLKARFQQIQDMLINHGYFNLSEDAKQRETARMLDVGRALMAIDEVTTAAAVFHKAAGGDAPSPLALVELGQALDRCDRLHDAINAFRRAVTRDPKDGHAIGSLIRALQDACLWQELARLQTHQATVLPTLQGRAAVAAERPFASLIASDDPAGNRVAAERYAALVRHRAAKLTALNVQAAPDRPRIRVGYLSSDFRYHPVGQLAAATLPRHDTSRFETVAYSLGPDDGSEERQTIAAGVGTFRDMRGQSDQEIANTIAFDGIDILVDLNGYTRWSRPGVLALRPAPINVWAIGFPGTSGSDFVDYIVADRTVLPPDHLSHFSEQPCWLPDACQPLDDRHEPAGTATRASLGLPEDGLLFVSWQSPFKIDPTVFDLWMEILRAVPNSHLWLRPMPEFSRRNLGIEAQRRGVEASRLISAPVTEPLKPGYLQQLSLADLALDTLIYNGHATTSDLLLAGVPVITLLGRHFAGRVAASLLQSAGLPELVTYSTRAYRDLAVKLALDPGRRAGLRARLATLHMSAPLFDTPRYVRALERGYEAMWQRHCAGLPPAPIELEPES